MKNISFALDHSSLVMIIHMHTYCKSMGGLYRVGDGVDCRSAERRQRVQTVLQSTLDWSGYFGERTRGEGGNRQLMN